MVIEKVISENGKNTSWRVPSWFISVCVAIAILWISWISGGMVYCLGQFGLGERNTRSDGLARDSQILAIAKEQSRLQYGFDNLKIPPPWFANLVKQNGRHIEANRLLINEALVELKALNKRAGRLDP